MRIKTHFLNHFALSLPLKGLEGGMSIYRNQCSVWALLINFLLIVFNFQSPTLIALINKVLRIVKYSRK